MLDPGAAPLCPGCGAGRLAPVGVNGPAALWSCRRCQGTFASLAAVAQVGRTHGFGHPVLRVGLGVPRCRGCTVVLEPGKDCPTCASQPIACAACTNTMERTAVERLTIDVCRTCRAIWLDRGELGALVTIWQRRRSVAGSAERANPRTGTNGPAVLDGLIVLPDGLGAGIDLGQAAVSAVEQAPQLITGAGEGAIAAVQAVGEGAAEGVGSAGGFLLELLGGLFDGF
jgi:Zn-finger nucleic acid-binding protein